MLQYITLGDVLWAVWQSIKQYWSWKLHSTRAGHPGRSGQVCSPGKLGWRRRMYGRLPD